MSGQLERLGLPVVVVRLTHVLRRRRLPPRPGQRLAAALTALGPSFVKLGQALSTRADLVGEDVAADLSQLQDKLAAFPAAIVEMRFSNMAFRLRNWRSPDSRRLNYLEYVLANDEHAKEVKLFGLGPSLLQRYREIAERFYREDTQMAVRRTFWAFVLSLLGTFAFYGAYAAMAIGAAMGKDPCLPPGTLGAITTGVPTVLIGGFPMPTWMNVAKGLGKLAKGIRRKVGKGGRGSAGKNH